MHTNMPMLPGSLDAGTGCASTTQLWLASVWFSQNSEENCDPKFVIVSQNAISPPPSEKTRVG